VRWSYNIHQDGNQTSFHGNPLVTDQLVLIGTDKSCATGSIGHVYAFDRATGTVRWKYRTAGTPTDIVHIDSTIYAASVEDELDALNLADGQLRWKFATGTPNPDCILPPAPAIVGKRVFYAGLDGVLYGLDGRSGKILWKHDFGRRPTTKLTVVDNSLYLGNSTSKMFRISADDGHVQSEISLPAAPTGRLLADGGTLYIFLEDTSSKTGYLMSTDLNLSKIGWIRKTDRAWSSEWPRIWNGLLLAGNCRGELEAFNASNGAPQWADSLKGCLRSIGTDVNDAQIYVGAQQGTVYAYAPAFGRAHDRTDE
jgi:outer membrane protein assembly factor BamB